MRSRKLLAFILCLITGPALAGYMTLLGAGLGTIQPVAQATFTNSSYSTNLSALSSVATFSRAGNAMQFDSSGYLTYAPNNLLTQSNTFNNAAWSSLNGGTGTAPTVTSGQSDPLGGTSAFRVQAARGASNTTGDYSFIYNSFTSQTGVNYAGGMWIKSNTGSSQTVSIWLNTGAAVSSTAFVTATTSWQFLSPSVLNATGASNLLAIGTRGGTYGGQATVDVLVYAAVASAVTYETTPRSQDQVITTSAAYYGPRFDYTYNGSSWVPAGLLVEGAATNSAYQAFNIADAGWAAAGGSKSNATDLSGGNTAQLFTPSAVNTTHYLRYATAGSLTNATVYTMTAYVKFGGASFIWIGDSGGSSWVWGSVNTSTLAVATAGTVSSSMAAPVAMGGGVYKLQLTWTRDLTAAVSPVVLPYTATSSGYGNVGYPTWTPAGTETFTLLGVQIEPGTAGSSPIITAGGAVTRAAETVQLTGTALSTALGSVASAFVEVGGLPVQSGTIRYLQYGAGSGILLGMSGGSATTVYEQNTAGSAFATAVAGSGSIATTLRAGISWGSTGGRKLVANGGAVVTDASNTELATGTVNLGQGQGTYINGWLRSFAIYNSRLPDATLQSKSVVGASY